ncbi:ATP-binding protein [Halalkalibacter alkaliphilus]|uniref:histidine kinase n=1 Tax=Halalkalibacter alkaliphilus TaxID=2917993 RepID=A0A9X2CUD9_9BACI|nr:ATP-binding protein [Halalkalibacter alkaliphilus]MCL7748438.1 ATP-binding protein [Halalkalibacter alkaliphilus]
MLDKYITEVKKRCLESGLDPNEIPLFTRVTDFELNSIHEEYKDTLSVIRLFINKFLSKTKGTPLFVTVTDDKGTFIEYMGDESLEQTVVHQVGLKKGVQFTESKAGVSSILAAIELERPIQVLGTDHYHNFLHTAACYSVPLYVNDKLVGTISIMTFLDYAHPMILATLETVVDSIKSELDLREQNRYLDKMNQMMLEQSTTGYIVLNKEGKIVNVNPKAQAILPEVQLRCKFIQDIEAFNNLYKQFQDGQNIRSYEIRIHNSKNSVCLVDYFPFLEGSLIQLHDISEYKKTEAYIQDAEKLSILGQLAAGIAHEIKNPLTTLKGFIQLIQEKSYDESFTPIMIKEIERINDITNEFLDLSRPTVLTKEIYDIQKIFQELEVFLSSLALPKNIEFLQTYKGATSIYCDGNQLKQVFINIFKNCVEAVEHNGKIHLTVEPYDSDNILIRLEDNGDGFPEHILNKMGQPFVTTKKHGHGLGIMVCKRIIETVHLGQLKMYNKNSGAVIDIILPHSNN